jgi:hypothetical protein
METYKLRTKNYYYDLTCRRDSYRLFSACWSQYRAWLRGAIDSPTCDRDVLDWLDSIASEKVNNSRSKFYIYG